jgi:hypothetical protein
MRNTTFSRLALFGLAAVSSFAFAANTVSGDIRFDATFTTSQKTAAGTSVADSSEPADNLYVSRARLNFAGDIAKSWAYFVRAEYNEYENAQLGLDSSIFGATLPVLPTANTDNYVVFSRAYATWMGLESVSLSLGLIGTPDISADNMYYKPYIGSWPNNKSVGNIVDYSGDHPGVSVMGKAGPVGYSFGVWKQTDLRKVESFVSATPAHNTDDTFDQFQTTIDQAGPYTFDSKSLRLGYAGRITFAPTMASGTAYGVGIGYNQAPLNAPVVVGTIETFGDNSSGGHSPAYTLASFNNLSNLAIDAAAVFGAVQVNVGFQSQTLKFDTATSYGTTTAASAIFSENGKATAWWIEAGYLLMGDSYKFDTAKAVVSGVKLREGQAGLEITARFGTETRKNVLALLNQPGYTDFSSYTAGTLVAATPVLSAVDVLPVASNQAAVIIAIDNTPTDTAANTSPKGTQIVISDTTAYQTKANGYAVNVNYYVNENAMIKAEFEQVNNKFERMYSASAWNDSVNAKSVSTIRLRAEFSF